MEYLPRFIILKLILVFCVTDAISSHLGDSKIWQNLDEFYSDGWQSTRDSVPGVALDKPSKIRPDLSPLDEGVTGGGIWTGRDTGDNFRFFSIQPGRQICGHTSLNISVTYYFADKNNTSKFHVAPCLTPSLFCVISPASDLLWRTEEFPLNIGATLQLGILLTITGDEQVEEGRTALFNEVRLIHNGRNC